MRTLLILIAVCLFSLPSVSEAAAYILDGHLATVDTAAQDRKILEVREGKTIYANLPHGYSIAVPPGMVVDVSLSAVRTVFADSQTQVEIYYDDLSGQTASAADYVAYGRRFVDRSGEHRVLQDRVLWHNGLPVHILKWMRRPLKHLPVDRRYYATAEFIKNEREIYTVFIKSAEPIQNELDLINSFRLSEKTGRAGIYLPPQASAGALTPQAQQLMNEYFAVSSPLRWGIFHPNAPDSFRHLDAIEQRLNYRFPFLVRYQSLSDELPVVALHRARREGRYVELTLQTYYYDQDNTAVMYDILDGRFDDYFRQYARDLRDFASPVLFRLNNE